MPASERPKTAAYADPGRPLHRTAAGSRRKILEPAGVQTVYNKTYPSETTDYSPIAAGIISAKADIVLVGTLLPDVSAFVKQFVQQNYNPKALIATAGPDQGAQFIQNVGANHTEGIMVPNGWYPTADNPGNADMVKAYTAQYGGTPAEMSSDVPEAYSVGEVTAQAVKNTEASTRRSSSRSCTQHVRLGAGQGEVRLHRAERRCLLFRLPVAGQGPGALQARLERRCWSRCRRRHGRSSTRSRPGNRRTSRRTGAAVPRDRGTGHHARRFLMGTELSKAVVDGVLTGGVYALMAAGLTLIFGVMEIINIAQGSLWCWRRTSATSCRRTSGSTCSSGCVVTMPVMFGVGVSVEWGFVRRLKAQNRSAAVDPGHLRRRDRDRGRS